MDLYSRKQRWKFILGLIAVLIVAASLWYSNNIVSKIREEERNKVQLWAEAVQSRAKLVNYTNALFDRLREEERKKVELWAEAMVRLVSDYNNVTPFYLKIVADNTTVPVVITDENGIVKFKRNLDPEVSENDSLLQQEVKVMSRMHDSIPIIVYQNEKQYLYYKDSKIVTDLEESMERVIRSFISETVMNNASVPVIFTDSSKTRLIESGNVDTSAVNSPSKLQERIQQMAAENTPIQVELGDGKISYIFYEGSPVIKQLAYFPYIQLLTIGLFLLFSYLLFSTFRNAEQNQVWVGMAKETAHQLGTPLSSLMAWIEILKSKGVEVDAMDEMAKDTDRLQIITERFSKIGSAPELKPEKLYHILRGTVLYLRPRMPKKAKIDVAIPDNVDLKVPMNRALFSWVIENLIRNAIDAMEGAGEVIISIDEEGDSVHIDIEDNGKGIPTSQHLRVFQPGFTTKKRGWGLGLSLTKRIIENYHGGRIFVKRSVPNVGTTFRITLSAQ